MSLRESGPVSRSIPNHFFKQGNDELCEGSGDVVGVLTLLVGGVAQAFHDDRVVELRVQLGVEELERKRTGRNRWK